VPGIGHNRVNGCDGLQTENDATAKNYGNSLVYICPKVKQPKPMTIAKFGETA
jgi:hypothetical protein